MEEVWKDMSLCSTPLALQSHRLHSPADRGAAYPQDYLAGAAPQPPRTPTPHTALTYLGGSGAANSATSSGGDSAGCHFGFSASGGGSRRAVVQPAVGGDPRQRRMFKNRESAARSRARKKAHANEMEQELEQLRRENRMLIQREEDFINDRLAKAAKVPVPDSSSSSNRSRRSTLQQKLQQQQQRCRSAPPP